MSIQNDMSIDEAIQYMEALVSNNPMFPPMKEAAKIAIDALHEKQEAEKNDPLSIPELLQMDEQPVWISRNDGYMGWRIVDAENEVLDSFGETDRIILCGTEYTAYRHPKEAASHED